MPTRLQEITATFGMACYRFESADGDVLIAEAHQHVDDAPEKSIKIKCQEEGEGDSKHPQRHRTYRFYGQWSNYTNKRTGVIEKQFHAKTFVAIAPHSRAGIIAYLKKAPNIGDQTARKLWDKFGSDAVKILRNQPCVAAAAIGRLSDENAIEASEWLAREQKLEDCTIELIDLFDKRGFPKRTIKSAIGKYGNMAATILKLNPYLTMQFRGCGFKRADALYLDLGKNPATMKRQALCAWHAIASASTGDTWHYVEYAKRALSGSIGGVEVDSDKALRLAVRGQIISVTNTDGLNGPPAWDGTHTWVAEEKKARHERELARLVCECLNEPGWKALGIDLDDITGISDHQRDEIGRSMSCGSLAVLRGYAGSGKSHATGVLARNLLRIFSPNEIGACAPTGKASVRITETFAENHLPLAAKTIHSTLGVDVSSGDGWSFKHGPGNPLPYRVLIVDEVSMVDTTLAYSLMAARDKNCLVLMIGDPAQLSPVGHGAPLRDLVAAGIPSGELTHVWRNDGGILEACSRIRQGFPFEFHNNLHLTEARTAERQKELMCETIDRVSKELNLNPVWDFQVICAVNKNSEIARRELNKVLQAQLNPNPVIRDCPFRLHDKVVNNKNGWMPPSDSFFRLSIAEQKDVTTNEKGLIYVANGDFGRVIRIEKNFMEVVLQAPKRIVIVPRGTVSDEGDQGDGGDDGMDVNSTGCNFDLGYAESCHKFQGAQVPVAIVMLDDSNAASRVCDRSWLYTAISRAKLHCYCIGMNSTAQAMVRRTSIEKRKTFLREFILEELKNF